MNKKIMIFGDSIFKGITYSDEKQKYIICEHDYINKLRSEGFDVFNHSKMGATVCKITEIAERFMKDMDSNTVVVFGFGGNDCDHDWQAVSDEPLPVSKNKAKVPFAEFEEKYRSLIRSVRRTGACVLISNLVPLDMDKFMDYISKNRSRENILSFLGDISMLYRWQEQYSNTVESIARKMNCPVIDVRSKFLLSHNYKELIASDGIHPTALGHELVSEALWEFLRDIDVQLPVA